MFKYGKTRGIGSMMSLFALLLIVPGLPGASVAARQPPPHMAQGGGIIIELDNEFIKKYENRATIGSEFSIVKLSKVHAPADDAEVHVGGWSEEAGLATVAEVMNAASSGTIPRLAFVNALAAGQKVNVTGAWRIWCEHGGTTAQIQVIGPKPPGTLPGAAPSNPDHVFEIHPVTEVKVGAMVTSATNAIGPSTGFTPHTADEAFLPEYERLTCTIIPKNTRTRIVTEASKYNFTDFVFQLGENPFELDDGYGMIGSVFSTSGELLVNNRRVVFIKGTAAGDLVKAARKGDRFHLTGIPRISLKLVQYRLTHRNELKQQFGTDPLSWRLPYEMIAVAAVPLSGIDD